MSDRAFGLGALLGLLAACSGERASLGAIGGTGETLDPGPEGGLDEPVARAICGDAIAPARQQPTLLSPAFENQCAGCHGSLAEGISAPGSMAVPALDGASTFEQYAAAVRGGRQTEHGRMPAFGPELISDDQLRADWEVLAATPVAQRPDAARMQPVALPGGLDDPSAVSDAIDEGLVLWRQVGKRGSCAGCHGPEGIDLARLGYRDSDILRRAVFQEMTDEQSHALVRMVRAQRTKHEMSVCDPRQPFLQPGGAVLSGQTVAERDLALVDELREHGVDLEQPVLTVAQAHHFMHRLLEVGVMNIRVPFEFNRWTEDRALGDEHRSVAEWVPEYAREPAPEHAERWWALNDAYIADPSDANLWALYDAVPVLTEAALELAEGSDPDSASAYLMRRRYQSVLIGQHMMRYNLVEFPARFNEEEREYLKTQSRHSNDERYHALLDRDAVWDAGESAMTINRGHSDDLDLAPFVVEKMSWDLEQSRALMHQEFGFAAVPWMWLGLASDPALQFTRSSNNGRISTEYFETRFTRTLDANTLGSSWPTREDEYLIARELQRILIQVNRLEGFDESLPNLRAGGRARRGWWAGHRVWNAFGPPPEDGADDESSPPKEREGIEAERERAHDALVHNFQRAAFFLSVVDMQQNHEYGVVLADPGTLTRMRDHLIEVGGDDEADVWHDLHETAMAAWVDSECIGDACDAAGG